MASYLKSEPESLQCSFEIVRSVDEEGGVLDLLFLAEFTEKQHGESRGSRLKEPDVEEFIHLWIDSGVQPAALVVDLNHCLVNHNLIRSTVAGRL